ncbi:MFS transporter [Secundilactobacillus paracollinoides]|uniref:MFS transporter n=1 Tax=Secundilactobacillus paracollinoides TaxID=240427 RepID=UPI0006D07E0F|nr:MFS transporter [Secundilactobacillus paracollinoides]
MHKRFTSFALLLILIAANMRIAIIVIPPLTTMLQHSLGLSTSQIGSLTSIPLLCFGLFSAIGSLIIKKVGLHTTLITGLIVLTIANFVRVYSPTLLFIGTLFVGLAIAVLNIGIPILVLSWFPGDQIRLNGLYTASLNLFAAIVAGGTATTAQHLGWQHTVQLISIPALLAVIYLGIFLLRTPKQVAQPAPSSAATTETAATPHHSVYQNSAVWLLMVFMGVQSAIYYARLPGFPVC